MNTHTFKSKNKIIIYLNIFFLILILILLFIFSIKKTINNKISITTGITRKYKNSSSQIEKENKRNLIMPIFHKNYEEKSEKLKHEIKNKVSQNKIKFKTANEVFKNFFPNIEKEFGKDIHFFLLKNNIATFLNPIDSPLTQEQEKLRRTLIKKRSLDIRKITPKNCINIEEEIEREEKLNVIQEKYTPLFVNILTKEQQDEVIIIYEEIILNNLREMKDLNQKFSLNRIKDLRQELEQKK